MKKITKKSGIGQLEGMLNKTFGLKKPAVKKLPPPKKTAPRPTAPPKGMSREEILKKMETSKPGSAEGVALATAMLPFIEKDMHDAKVRKVKYFPPVKREEVVKPPMDQKAQQAKKILERVIKAQELPQIPQVTLAEICKELKKDASEVRKMLRDKKVPKPGTQWSWPKTDEKNIKLIRGLIKVMPKT